MKIGTIAKAQGIKGDVKLNLDIEFEKIENLKEMVVGGNRYAVENLQSKPNGVFAKFAGVEDRTLAENMRGLDVEVNRKDLNELAENEFYFEDLIGAKVVDEMGQNIGEIEDIEQYGAADVVVVNQNGRLYSVPFLNDIFIKFIASEKMMIVDKARYNDMKVI